MYSRALWFLSKSENLLESPGLRVAEEALGVDERFSGELNHHGDFLLLVMLSPGPRDKTESHINSSYK